MIDGARWYEDTGLVFADMTRGGVHGVADDGTSRVLIAHRKGIGGLVAHAAGGFVVSGRNVAHKAVDGEGGPTTVLLETADDEVFFNDLGVDDRGRVFVGSVAHDPLGGGEGLRAAGRLYCLGLDGAAEVVADDVLASNGIGIDPGATVLYHVDSGRRTVWSYRLDDHPHVSSRAAFAETSAYDGVPDGLAVAADGSVWVAMAGGGVVVGWDARGAVVAEIDVPQPMVTALAFGGEGHRTLYVTTAPDDHRGGAGGPDGSVYVVPAPAPGSPGLRAAVPLGAHHRVL
ncbi:MAG: SMP-30/gluconolactonase/LRE family protein [Acidimicrobiia bacterium]